MPNTLTKDVKLYLLRNHSSDKAISFFTESGFRPDFILWLLHNGKQTITFIDPKGLRNLTNAFNNEKIKLARDIKTLESELQRKDIRLESYIISQTNLSDLRWASPDNKGEEASEAEYKDHHIICAKDNPETYMRDLIVSLIEG